MTHSFSLTRKSDIKELSSSISAVKMRLWRSKDPERTRTKGRADSRKHKFGLTNAAYLAMVLLQGGVCAICKQPETQTSHGRVRDLTVDHDRNHCAGNRSCGLCIRGLICSKCNVGLGMFSDSPDRLIAAANYLTRGTVSG